MHNSPNPKFATVQTTIAMARSMMASLRASVWAIAAKVSPYVSMASGAVVPALPPNQRSATAKITIVTD
jgi:hypothetical protein